MTTKIVEAVSTTRPPLEPSCVYGIGVSKLTFMSTIARHAPGKDVALGRLMHVCIRPLPSSPPCDDILENPFWEHLWPNRMRVIWPSLERPTGDAWATV